MTNHNPLLTCVILMAFRQMEAVQEAERVGDIFPMGPNPTDSNAIRDRGDTSPGWLSRMGDPT